MDLKDKVVIVTGGGTGLGKATSLAMAREGTHIAVIYSRSEADAFSTAMEIEGLGVKAIAVKADVSNSKAVNAMVEKVMQEFVHYLIATPKPPAPSRGATRSASTQTHRCQCSR